MIEVNNISYSIEQFSLKNIHFSIEKGDYFALIGPSGAGKTLIIEILAGIILPKAGQLRLEGEDITHLSSQKRLFPVVFQDYALFPHLTVLKNIEFGLRTRKISVSKRNEITAKIASELAIKHLLTRYPNTLSGGEQQRVAIARALACEPLLLILDEPLASIDESGKDELVALLKQINKNGTTIVHVTHHYEEALILSNKIAMINNGEIVQWGVTNDVFRHPKHPFVARFIGYRDVYNVNFINTDTSCAHVNDSLIKFEITEKKQGEGFVYISENDVLTSFIPFVSEIRNCFSGEITEVIRYPEITNITIDIGIRVHCNISQQIASNSQFIVGQIIFVHIKPDCIMLGELISD